MKSTFCSTATLALMILFSCNSLTKRNTDLEKATAFGDPYNDSTVLLISVDSLQRSLPLTAPLTGVFTGKVSAICQSRGCWIKLENPGGQDIFVDTDESFTMPSSIVGKTVRVNGYAFMDTTDVETLRHFAEDEGKSKEEISKITIPAIEVSIKTTGVKIR